MDNFRLDLVADGRENFDRAMAIAFSYHPRALAYLKERDRFVLMWSEDMGPLPVGRHLAAEMDLNGAGDLVWAWLQDEADYGEEPVQEGEWRRGFRIYTGEFEGVPPAGWRTLVGVQPVWAGRGEPTEPDSTGGYA